MITTVGMEREGLGQGRESVWGKIKLLSIFGELILNNKIDKLPPGVSRDS